MSYICRKIHLNMIHAGRYHTLKVSRISDYGLYLASDEGDEVLLPNRYVSMEDKVGDEKRVFVYHDSEDRLVATTETPAATVGDIAFLKVVDRTQQGAFLDWGLFGKDLFLPNRNQQAGVVVGKSYVVYVYEDNITGRTVATEKLHSAVNNDELSIKPKEQVELLVASASEIGYRVIINSRHWGMLYRNQLFRPIAVGERLTGYVRRITEDNRVDVSLQQEGYDEVKVSAEKLLDILRQNGGKMALGDNSTPDAITAATKMSKKVFKRSLGLLMKRGDVLQTEEGIKLIQR